MLSSVGLPNEVMREPLASWGPLDPAFAFVLQAIAAGDGSNAARELCALSDVAHDDAEVLLDLVTRALDLAMPTDQRLALLSMRARGSARRGDMSAAERDYREACSLASRAGFRREEARLLGELGMSAYALCDFTGALEHWTSALSLQATLGDAAEQAVTLTRLALVHRERGAVEDARDAATRALSIHRTTRWGDVAHEAATLIELARCDLDEENLVRARERLTTALRLAETVASTPLVIYARFIAAIVEHASGDVALAEREWIDVIHASRAASQRAGLPYALLRLEGGAFACLGLLAFDRGDWAEARTRLEDGIGLLEHSGGARHAALAKGYLAACARMSDDEARASKLFTDARSMVADTDRVRLAIDLLQATSAEGPLPAAVIERARGAWESRHALERHERLFGGPAPAPVPLDAAFQVAIDGAWLQHDGERVSCQRRAATQRLLATLARARTDAPGEIVSTDTLIAAGWPNEAVATAAGKNRVRVALSWLRKRGLGRALASRGDGYLLDPGSVAVLGSSPAEDAGEGALTTR